MAKKKSKSKIQQQPPLSPYRFMREKARKKFSNDLLTVTIDSFGAEIHSVINNRTHSDYLWCGDKRFWGRHSPVLFPLVGQVWEGIYRMDGKEYRLGQHGFARDKEFVEIPSENADEAWFALESSDDTLKLYPRRFRLEIGYRLRDAHRDVACKKYRQPDNAFSYRRTSCI